MSTDQIAATAPTAATRRRALTVTLWVAQVLFVALFLFAALGKLTSDPNQVAGFAKIGAGQWLRYATGVLELAGAIGLLIPRLAGAAALGLVGIMVGAVGFHLTVAPPMGFAVIPAIVGTLLALIAYARRDEIKALVTSLRR
ncbi:MAG: DoxX family protein [Micromonosporaceae bacterium]